MSFFGATTDIWTFSRERTLGVLDAVAELPDPQAVLGWRPGPGRAHIAWQLMHVGITEELFATERLGNSSAAWPDLVPRYKGGSTPDEEIPTVEKIRSVLHESREHWLSTVSGLNQSDLDEVPAPLAERGWTLRKVLQVLIWHEPHHQGQAHITLNLWKATQS